MKRLFIVLDNFDSSVRIFTKRKYGESNQNTRTDDLKL